VETARVAVPGGSYPVSVTLANRSARDLRVAGAEISAPAGWRVEQTTPAPADVPAGGTARALFRVTAPAEPAFTVPYWRRDSVEDAIYTVDDPTRIGDALPPFPLEARIRYAFGGADGAIGTTVQTRTIDPLRGEIARDLAIEPGVSVRTSPPLAVVPLARLGRGGVPVEVEVSPNAGAGKGGTVSLDVPPGWPKPAPQTFSIPPDAPSASVHFDLAVPRGTRAGLYRVRADADGESRTLEFLDHPDLAPFYFVKPAETRVEVLDLAVPPDLSIGYVRGAEDTIPEFLQQLGIRVHLLGAEELEKGNLSAYPTIVTGPRAYDVRADLRAANGRLLDYVRAGGRLVVQYNSGTRALNAGNYFPYPAKFPDDNARVTVEDSPVEMLAPEDRIWSSPNRITPRDFDGWVQERGLYFLGEWATQYTPLLSMHDPDEPPLRGGLLTARFGKGTYIFTAESWFRELPEGVPGAIRIFVNLITPATAR
ncbi:MAG TPA: NEW3 domain-containing protein, partial [Thermoanaerobaculia bacterium]|nr:NEW3 domain-containing protein [Thermoanaerobaculia bacterium]